MTSKREDVVQQELLSGWKDIASYLGRGVRTVQRYERKLNLPVRRVLRSPSGPVVATKSDLDSWVRSSPTAQESFNKETRTVEEHLVSDIAKGLQQQAELRAQMLKLRNELKMSVKNIRENILQLRQQLNETRRRQDSIASVIRKYSDVPALMSIHERRRKPN
jgi:septal ring factor EnvC (AmiA/AmiB activator)